MDRYRENRKIFSLSVIVLAFFYVIQFLIVYYYPTEIKIAKGENSSIEVLFPFSLSALHDEDTIVQSTYNEGSINGLKKILQNSCHQSRRGKISVKTIRFDTSKKI